ncbi:MAG TPA: DUF4124 domain-containing protein [Rhodanobacteraceae bacterium]|nr:DUF4124 domain-containing protein [Rhodanobacteraceae bacterium]
MSSRNAIAALVFFLLVACMAAPVHAGDIYACKDAHGNMAYQDKPCPTKSKTVGHGSYTPVPDAPYSSPYAQEASQDQGDAAAATQATGTDSVTTSVAQPSPCAGIGCSQHASGQTAATQCTAPDGRVYYTTRSCTARSHYVGTTSRDWQRDTVQGHADAVMINRNEALDPRTGRVMQLDAAPLSTPVYQRTRDAGQQVNIDAGCQGARADARMHPHDAKAAKRARDVCGAGRGLWDQAPPDHGTQ